jgi:hypothetical protein
MKTRCSWENDMSAQQQTQLNYRLRMTDTRQMAGVVILSTPTLPSSFRSYNYNKIYDHVYFDVREFWITLYNNKFVMCLM